jgi:hypothetical protein
MSVSKIQWPPHQIGEWAYQMIQQLVTNNPDHFKGLSGSDRVHNDISVDANVQLRVHETVFILDNRCQSIALA